MTKKKYIIIEKTNSLMSIDNSYLTRIYLLIDARKCLSNKF
jgi:hypothetical protein